LTYSATDSSGNTATAIRIVNVLDTTPPELVLIGDPESTIEVGTPYTGSDVSCSGCGTHEITFQGWIQVGNPSEVSWNSVGTYTITYYCTDESGNSSSVSKIINVVDTIGPEILCDSLDIYLDENGEALIVIDDIVNSVSDISGVAEVSTTSELTFDCSMIGSNEVVITAIDNYGNSSQCIPSVTVIDDMDPAPVCTIDIVTLTLENGLAFITEDDIDNGSYDNCGIESIELSKVEFTEEDLGSNTITMTVTDVNDNISSCEVEVMVEAGLSVTENIIDDLLLYPNPTKGVIYLSKNIEINYGIYNSIGQKVIEGVTSDEINISQLANGMYYIKIEVENQTTNRKIIKN